VPLIDVGISGATVAMSKPSSQEFDIPKLSSALPKDTPQRLHGWFAARMPQHRPLLQVTLEAPASGAGFSGDTHIVVLRWEDAGRCNERKFVLRAELVKAHNPESDFHKMVRLQKVLGDIPGSRVPKVWFSEDDASILGGPFYVMEYIEGRIARDNPPFAAEGWVRDATAQQRQRLYRSGLQILANLHKLNWKALALEFLMLPGSAATQTRRHLDFMIDIYDRAMDGKRRPLAESAIGWLLSNMPATETLCISWGDPRLGNMLVRDFDCVAALDWEMATLADPAADVAWWIFFERSFTEGRGVKRPPGMPDRDGMIAMYQQVSGDPLESFRYHEVFAGFRAYAIATHMAKVWERAGLQLFGPEGSIDNNPSANTFAELMRRV
jgi:aminoglycoside phosphotransferase (APT) family kinase protein